MIRVGEALSSILRNDVKHPCLIKVPPKITMNLEKDLQKWIHLNHHLSNDERSWFKAYTTTKKNSKQSRNGLHECLYDISILAWICRKCLRHIPLLPILLLLLNAFWRAPPCYGPRSKPHPRSCFYKPASIFFMRQQRARDCSGPPRRKGMRHAWMTQPEMPGVAAEEEKEENMMRGWLRERIRREPVAW